MPSFLPVRRRLAAALLLSAGWMATAIAAPTVTPFATGLPTSLYGITSDATRLYFTGATGALRNFNGDPTNGVVASIPLAGGPVTTLYSAGLYASASGHVAPFQITTDGAGNLYWADPDAGPSTGASFIQGTAAGAAPVQFFGICCGPAVLPGDGTGLARGSDGLLYFGDGIGGRVGVNPSGSSAVQIGPTRYGPDFNTEQFVQVAVAKGKIFIADSAEQRGATGAGVAVLVDESAAITPGVRWISLDGSSGFVDLSVGRIGHPRGIVAKGKDLYVTSRNTVWKVKQDTGATSVFVKDRRFQDLQGITYANGAFYVLDSQTRFGAPVGDTAEATSDGPGKIWKIVP